MNTLLKSFFFTAALAILPARGEQPQTQLQQAVDTYQAAFETVDRDQRLRLFRRAEILFEQVAREAEIENADLYVNLGNAALGAERIGPAILAFQRALAIDPTNRRARQNREHARSLLPDWVPRPEESAGVWESMFGSLRNVSTAGLLQTASLVFLVAAILSALAIRTRRGGLHAAGLLLAACWIMLLGFAVWSTQQTADALAVVVVPETVARSADSVNAPPRLSEPLPSGAEVQIIEHRRGWLHVRMFDGRDAWLPESSIAPVSP